MFSEWTSHLKTDEEKKRFEGSVHAARPVLERLQTLIEMREQGIESLEGSLKQFESPAWPYRQAFNNGFKAALNKISLTINLDQQEHK